MLRQHWLNYLGKKYHDNCNLFSSSLANIYFERLREIKQTWGKCSQWVNLGKAFTGVHYRTLSNFFYITTISKWKVGKILVILKLYST